MIFLGVDPDTKATGIGCFDTERGPLWVRSIKAKGRLEEDRRLEMAIGLFEFFDGFHADGIAIEWQVLHAYKERNPNSIMAVHAVGGMVLASASRCRSSRIEMPYPVQWRGSQPKPIAQLHILEKLGLTRESAIFSGMTEADKSHVIDGLGLAHWMSTRKQ